MDCEKELAALIRLGALRRPVQAIGHYFEGSQASCALGAAYEGMYRLPGNMDHAHPSKDMQLIFFCLDTVRQCPGQGCKKKLTLAAIIVHLNDDHKWTREGIAAWVGGDQVPSP